MTAQMATESRMTFGSKQRMGTLLRACLLLGLACMVPQVIFAAGSIFDDPEPAAKQTAPSVPPVKSDRNAATESLNEPNRRAIPATALDISAQKKRDAAMKKAQEAYEQARVIAEKQFVDDLKVALNAAMADRNVDDVKRIDAAVTTANRELNALTSGEMKDRAPGEGASGEFGSAKEARANNHASYPIAGKIAFLIKGEGFLYLNGKQIATAGNGELIKSPVTLSDGDRVVVRARSRFVYRYFRIGFVPNTGTAKELVDLRLLGDVAPERVDVASIEGAAPAASGRTDGGVDHTWSSAGLPEDHAGFGVPQSNQWFTFGVVVKSELPVSPTTRRSIEGVWQEAPGVFVSVIQSGGQWTAHCSYSRPDATVVHWDMEGAITAEGNIQGTLIHTLAPPTWKISQVREAKLSPDANTISGTAKWDGGGDSFTWTRMERAR